MSMMDRVGWLGQRHAKVYSEETYGVQMICLGSYKNSANASDSTIYTSKDRKSLPA